MEGPSINYVSIAEGEGGNQNVILRFLCCFFQRAKRGQYQVIDKIAAYLDYLNPGVDEAKAHIDHIIDLCGVPPSGNYSD